MNKNSLKAMEKKNNIQNSNSKSFIDINSLKSFTTVIYKNKNLKLEKINSNKKNRRLSFTSLTLKANSSIAISLNVINY